MTDTSQPAFPCSLTSLKGLDTLTAEVTHGMTLRDWFAGQALTGFLAHGGLKWEIAQEQNDIAAGLARVSEGCYLMADAMLEARK